MFFSCTLSFAPIVHPAKRANRADKRAPCTAAEIRTMRQMRFDGFTLAQIAIYVDRSAPCVWTYTKDVPVCDNSANAHWKKDRVVQHGGYVALTATAY